MPVNANGLVEFVNEISDVKILDTAAAVLDDTESSVSKAVISRVRFDYTFI